MFGKKHQTKRSTNPLFVIFRLCLSCLIFVVLLAGIYSAYKHFTGLDPLKVDPQAVVINLLRSKTPQDAIAALGSIKATSGIAQKLNESILGQSSSIVPADDPQTVQSESQLKVALRFLLVSDSHSDNKNLAKALQQAKLAYPDIKFIIGLGDYSEVGTVTELKEAKKELDLTSLRYFLIPGDHDLWDARNKSIQPQSNFKEVFGLSYQSFSAEGYHFILLYNSDNYQGLSEEQLVWLDNELERVKDEGAKGVYVFAHTPLYHPSSDHVMGRVEQALKKQAKNLIYTLKSAEVKAVVAGDTHYFSSYEEPETHLSMLTIGAVTLERNLQTPRYAVGEILEDGSLRVVDVEIK